MNSMKSPFWKAYWFYYGVIALICLVFFFLEMQSKTTHSSPIAWAIVLFIVSLASTWFIVCSKPFIWLYKWFIVVTRRRYCLRCPNCTVWKKFFA